MTFLVGLLAPLKSQTLLIHTTLPGFMDLLSACPLDLCLLSPTMSQQTLQDFVLGLHLPRSAYNRQETGTPSTAPYECVHSSGFPLPAFLRCDSTLQTSMLTSLRQQLSIMPPASEPVASWAKSEYEIILTRLESQPHPLQLENTTALLFETLFNPVKAVISDLCKQRVVRQDVPNMYNHQPDGILTSDSPPHERAHIEFKSWKAFQYYARKIPELHNVTMQRKETGHRAIFFKVVGLA
jgi:hypothetical protein